MKYEPWKEKGMSEVEYWKLKYIEQRKKENMERTKLAKIEHDLEQDIYLVKVAATDGTNVEFIAGTQLLDDLLSELERIDAELYS